MNIRNPSDEDLNRFDDVVLYPDPIEEEYFIETYDDFGAPISKDEMLDNDPEFLEWLYSKR